MSHSRRELRISRPTMSPPLAATASSSSPTPSPPSQSSSRKRPSPGTPDSDSSHSSKRRKRESMEDVNARYERFGVRPPPPLTNQYRFRLFVDRINRRQWEFLPNIANQKLSYNGESISLHELVHIFKEEFGQGSTSKLHIAAMVGGDIHPNPPAGKLKLFRPDPVAARICVRNLTPERGRAGSMRSPERTEYARHMVVSFDKGKISSIYDMREEPPRISRRKLAAAKPRRVLPVPGLRPPPPPVSIDLKTFYEDYIDAINSGVEHMHQEVRPFCKTGGVTHNGVHLSVDKYINLMRDAMDHVPDLKFQVHTCAVDEGRQMIAARLEFVGTPVKSWMGASPTGDEVEWSEHVFYWLEHGKISDVISIVDWETYREGLGQ
ncbi:hypothetical protein QC763_100920 [Podospora pseudopauciseta]|uniref:SnoaL-like domain-containing protein n=2 Tax=Podospora TaxID=5144 RepID=A0ABR0HVC5_9PEZI|nr:hypothetical protein QC763_100920 [Podospora pseudopauciseta]KAK4680569.1 hypothetical protein QC764_100920 [Podospora pseudoanserina]